MKDVNELYEEVITGIEKQKEKGMVFSDIAVAIHLIENYGLVVWCDDDEENCFLVSLRKNFATELWGDEIYCECTIDDDYETLRSAIDLVIKIFKSKITI